MVPMQRAQTKGAQHVNDNDYNLIFITKKRFSVTSPFMLLQRTIWVGEEHNKRVDYAGDNNTQLVLWIVLQDGSIGLWETRKKKRG